VIAAKSYVNNENLKNVKYTDTSAMLLPYLRKADTASLSSRINQKVSYTDTAAMLLPYLRKADTASLSTRINQKINYSDTTNIIATKTFLPGNYFKNGGNAFAGTATIGTTDNNPIDVIANNTRAMRVFANGNVSFGTGTTDAGYKGDFAGSIRSNSLIYSSSGGIGTEYLNYIGWRNAGQGWRIVMECTGLDMTIRDLFRSASPISNIAGLKIEIPTDGTVSISNAYNISALNKITAGLSRGGGNFSTSGTITSGEHTPGATNIPGTNLTITAGKGTGNNAGNGNIYLQTPDTVASGTAGQNYTSKLMILRNGAVAVGATVPLSTAIFEVQSVNRGVILCRMTSAQRDAIVAPAEGLEIYNITSHKKQVFDGTIWQDCW
jgi:hypothetical protein